MAFQSRGSTGAGAGPGGKREWLSLTAENPDARPALPFMLQYKRKTTRFQEQGAIFAQTALRDRLRLAACAGRVRGMNPAFAVYSETIITNEIEKRQNKG